MRKKIKNRLIELIFESLEKSFDDKYFKLEGNDQVIAGHQIIAYNQALSDFKLKIKL